MSDDYFKDLMTELKMNKEPQHGKCDAIFRVSRPGAWSDAVHYCNQNEGHSGKHKSKIGVTWTKMEEVLPSCVGCPQPVLKLKNPVTIKGKKAYFVHDDNRTNHHVFYSAKASDYGEAESIPPHAAFPADYSPEDNRLTETDKGQA